MRKLIVLFCGFMMLGSATLFAQAAPATKIKPKGELKTFLDRFQKAALSNDTHTLLLLMDLTYKKEQHDEFLKGNTVQFLDEFFCGHMVKPGPEDAKFACPGLANITKMKITSVTFNEEYHEVFATFTSGKKSFSTSWIVRARNARSGVQYGLVGAQG
jgi:hypothetical protein